MSRIEDLSSSVYESFAMLSGIQLDLFTHLAECPQTAEDLASQLDVRPDRLSVLCYGLAAAHDFSPFQTMLDVGAGSGGFSLGLTEKWTHLDVTLVGTSCPGELLDSFDVAVLKNFLQVLSPNDAQSALRNVIQTLHPGGRIYVTGHILDDTRTTPIETARFNLVFLNIYENGQAYTRNEYET